MSQVKSLYTPNTTAFGHPGSLPILSARDVDLSAQAVALAAGAVAQVAVPAGAQALEIDVLNSGQAAVTVWLLSTDAVGGTPATQVTTGIRRVVPAGAQLVETRGVMGGDTLLLLATGALDVRVIALVAGDAS